MRKTMTKEVTFTRFKMAKMEIVDGKAVTVELGEKELLGKWPNAKLRKEVYKTAGLGVIPYDITITTAVYKMDIETFLKHATFEEIVKADKI